MKKLTGITLAGLLFTGLVGCSETETKPAASEPKQEVKKEEVKPASKPAVKKEEVKPDTSVIDYTSKVSEIATGFAGNMTNFSNLTTKGAENPAIMTTDDWKIDVVTELTLMEQLIKQFREIKDVPPSMNKAHQLTGKAFDQYEFVIDNFPAAIDNMDVDLINDCTSHILEGNRYLNLATDAIKANQ